MLGVGCYWSFSDVILPKSFSNAGASNGGDREATWMDLCEHGGCTGGSSTDSMN